jgi:hypothetical protein
VGSTPPLNPLHVTPEPTSPKPSLTLNEPPKEPPPQKNSYSELFEKFWFECPRRIDKSDAFKAFEKAAKKVSADILIERMAAYANQCRTKQTETRFVKHPATWLNKGSWEDELDFTVPIQQKGSMKSDYFKDTVLAAVKYATREQ